MTSEVPTPPLVDVDNDVEALRVELAKCKSDYKYELELVCLEHTNVVQRLRTQIEELTIHVRANNGHQGLPTRVVIEGTGENSGG